MLGSPELLRNVAFVDFTFRGYVVLGVTTGTGTLNQERIAFFFAQWVADIIRNIFGHHFADIVEDRRRQLNQLAFLCVCKVFARRQNTVDQITRCSTHTVNALFHRFVALKASTTFHNHLTQLASVAVGVLFADVGGGYIFAFLILMLNVVHTESLEEQAIRVVLVRENAQIVIAVFQTGHINVIATFRSNIATGLVKQIK
ncbi:Uncharacterised protein [Enterobacter hormaechei]|nr:Uncharacterised protein [Enterobacter hormaechei]